MPNITHDLHEQAETAKILLANLAAILADDDELKFDTLEGETSLLEAMETACDRIAECDGFIDALDARIKTLSARKKRIDDQRKRIRVALLVAMEAADTKKIELATATVSRTKTAQGLRITNDAQIPAAWYVEQDPTLDKRAMLAALKAGEVIPGAQLSNAPDTIQIRRR